MIKKIIVIFLTGLALVSTSVNAEMMTIKVSASVTYVDDIGNALDNQMYVGDVITGTYTFDTLTVDSEPAPDSGKYEFAPGVAGMSFVVNNLTMTSNQNAATGAYSIEIFNHLGSDGYHVRSFVNLPLTSGASLQEISINFFDPTGTALNSDLLLNAAPDLARYEYSDINGYGRSADGLNFFNFQAKVNTVTVEGGTPEGTYQISAIVRDVYDPYNLLQGRVTVGDSVDGSYAIDLHAIDSDPAVNSSLYISPADPQYGFDVTINGQNFKSDSPISGPEVRIYNETSDNYQCNASEGSATGLDVNLDAMAVYLYDPTGQALSSSAQPVESFDLSAFEIKDMIISGNRGYTRFFHITAELVSLYTGTEPGAVVSPATESQFVPYQRFDMAIILPPQITSMPLSVRGNINGLSEPYFSGSLCDPWKTTITSQRIYLCHDSSQMLRPGLNRVDLFIDMDDGTTIHTQADWKLIE